MATTVTESLRMFRNLLQKAGPYVLIEILLPGGTLIALLLYLYRRGQFKGGVEIVLRVSKVFEQARIHVREIVLFAIPHRIVALLSARRSHERDGLEPLGLGSAW